MFSEVIDYMYFVQLFGKQYCEYLYEVGDDQENFGASDRLDYDRAKTMHVSGDWKQVCPSEPLWITDSQVVRVWLYSA